MLTTTLYERDISLSDREWILKNCQYIGIDTETTGLDPINHRLCLIQISAGDNIYIVRFDETYRAENVITLLENKNLYKVFHHATFDVSFLIQHLKIEEINNVICTKIAAKLLNGVKVKNSLKDLLYNYLAVTIDKAQQVSDWKKLNLSDEQVDYAANDVRYLVELWRYLEIQLRECGLLNYAYKCFGFISTQAYLENRGIKNIFQY